MRLPQVNRRTFIKGSSLAVLAAVAAHALLSCSTGSGRIPRGYEGQPRVLPVPPLLEGDPVDGRMVYRLRAQSGMSRILPDAETRTWGFNGTHLGPTLHLRRGEQVRMEVSNDLEEMTTVHWHGMKLPAVADGGPHSPIEPGRTWIAEWTVENSAATLWYHPHPHGLTGLHSYRGLAGAILVEDEVSDALDLPHTYGVDDIPLVLIDQRFTGDGALDETDLPDLGLLGDTPTVNGITNAQFSATTRRVRFRIVNGSNMRFYNLALTDGRAFQVIAGDSGLFAEPLERTHLAIGPGERHEIIIDLEPGAELGLEAVAFEDNFEVPSDEFTPDFGFGDAFPLLSIIGPPEKAPVLPALPGVLDATAAGVPDTIDAPERSFVLNTFSINDQMMDMQRIDVVIDHTGPEVWVVTNDNSDWPHNFHIHNCRFKVLSLSDTEVDLLNEGWKDTVSLPPGATARLAVEFGQHPDPTWPYMYHCHMLYHEDQGMMGQFIMVEPGGEPAARLGSGAHGHH